MPSNATKSTVREFVSRRCLRGRKSGIFVIAAIQSYRLHLSIGDYFFMTNNSYTVTTRVPPKVDIQPADMRALLDRQRASFLANGTPTYDSRIDRLDRLITMLVDNKDEITATLPPPFVTHTQLTTPFPQLWHISQ